MALAHTIHQMIQIAHPARGDHRHPHGIRDGAGQRQVKAFFGAVTIHRGEQDFTGAVFRHALRPGHRIQAGGSAPAMGEDLPLIRPGGARINRHHHTLAAEFLGRFAHKFRPVHRRRVDRGLVGAGQQQLAHIFHRAHAATHGERHEAARRRARHHVKQRVAGIGGSRDIQEGQFIGAGSIIMRRLLHRIAGIAQIDKIDALDDAAILHVEAGNDADLEAHAASRKAAAGSIRPA